MLGDPDQVYENWLKDLAAFDFENNGMKERFLDRLGRLASSDKDNLLNCRAMVKDETNHYEDISDVPISVRAGASLGSRKISSALLHKLVSRTLLNGEKAANALGASHACIDTMIYLCQICDNAGFISDFYITSLVSKTVASKRGAYFVLEILEKKGFIKVSCHHSKNGYRDIKILDNDFSNYRKDQRYLNLNRSYFNINSPDFQLFRNKSLFAKKLLLYILFMYDAQGGKRGYRANTRRLAKQLGIQNESLIVSYADELKPLCEDFRSKLEGWGSNLHTYKSKKTGSSDVIVSLRPDRCSAQPELLPKSPTHLKYLIETAFTSHGIPVVNHDHTCVSDDKFKDMVEELSGVVVWNALKYKDTPITVSDIVELLEQFICDFEYFLYDQVQGFSIYIREFVRLSRHLISPNYILCDR